MLRDDSAGMDNARTDQCQLPKYGPYSYRCKSTSRTICIEPIHFSNNHDKFAQWKLLLSSDVKLNPGPSDMDTVHGACNVTPIIGDCMHKCAGG